MMVRSVAYAAMVVAFLFGIGILIAGTQSTTGNTTGTDSSLTSTVIAGQQIPDPTGYVVDLADVLSADTESSLTDTLTAYAGSGHGEIAVLTVPTLNGLSPEEFGIRVAEAWKVGKFGVDNGEILIIAMQERKIRIETGSGSKITDGHANQIIQGVIVPLMKQGNVDEAVKSGVSALIQATN